MTSPLARTDSGLPSRLNSTPIARLPSNRIFRAGAPVMTLRFGRAMFGSI